MINSKNCQNFISGSRR